jgi:hypothetical protein
VNQGSDNLDALKFGKGMEGKGMAFPEYSFAKIKAIAGYIPLLAQQLLFRGL